MLSAGWPSRLLAIVCATLLVPGDVRLYAQLGPGSAPPSGKTLNAEQLQSLVAPIALYPDPLLAQVLAACTYPLEAVEADRWLQSNRSLQGEKLVQAAQAQDWEPSIQALVVFPDVLRRISQNLKWSTALGNAFLAQQEDVLSAVQAIRRTAQQAGTLQWNSQQKVATESGNIIVIQSSNPQVIYVPVYNPTVIYGALPYPYPAISYPPSTGAVVVAGLVSFGAGVPLGAAFRGCCGPSNGWGWGCNWRAGSVTINNNFFGRYGYATPYRGTAGSTAWAHNPYYRGGVPYSSATVAGRYGAATGVRTPYGAAGAVKTPYGSAAAVATRQGTAARMQTYPSSAGSSEWVGSRNMGSAQQGKASVFGSSGGAAETRAISNRGASSMRGAAGGGRRR